MSRNTGSGLKFARRIYPPRIFGMALTFPALAVVFYQTQVPWHFWLFAVFIGFLWPHLAYYLSSRAATPTEVEYRNLMCDSAFAGLCVPLTSFNLLVSLVLLTMTSLDNMSVGGWRLFIKGLVVSLVSVLVGWLWVSHIWAEFDYRLAPDLLVLIATAPVMVVFPLSIGVINFSLSRRLAHQREELERISRTDGLSQLSNRRFWEESVYREFERHKRSGAPLSLIMIDIDHFKQINDEYGHVAGDQMIREISDLLAAAVRQADVVGRYGGEEFGLLLPDTDLKGALNFAERLRSGVQALSVKPYGIRCTISLGVAEAGSDVTKYRQLIEFADQALYMAKGEGRNLALAYQPE